MERSPFRITKSPPRGALQWLSSRGAAVVERISGLDRLAAAHDALGPIDDPDGYLRAALAALEVRVDVAPMELRRVPAHGPALVVADHPFGMLDGMILTALIRTVRKDVRVMANRLLARIPALRELILPVEVLGRGSQDANARSLRQAIRWMRGGGLVVVFPAGEVAHKHGLFEPAREATWNPSLARLVRRAAAPVVPVHFDGENSALFQWAGLVHPRFRTLLLPRELWNKRGRAVRVRIGYPVTKDKWEPFADDRELLAYLRLRTTILGRDAARSSGAQHRETPRVVRPVAAPQDPAALAREVAALPPSSLLTESGELAVFAAPARRIPVVLQEIGRLRERTFRLAGEGTGRAQDLDAFDRTYLHLFLWERTGRRILGAYRIGRVDRLLRHGGPRALYTHTLFRFDRRFFEWAHPALELGRSFIVPEVQKTYRPLFLLWRGIGAWVAAHPRYRFLFGPVSVSRDYADLSRRLMIDHLESCHAEPDRAGWVRARRPPVAFAPQKRGLAWTPAMLSDFSEVSRMVEDIEPDQRGVPVLLREYLKLGGRVLGFNLDPAFGDVLDALIVVDLRATEPRLLERYLGKREA